MKYPSQSVALPYFVGALAIFALQLVFGLIGALDVCRAEPDPDGPAAVQRRAHDPHQRADRLAAARLLRLRLLPAARRGGARDLFADARATSSSGSSSSPRRSAVVGYLFGNYDGALLSRAAALGQARHHRRRADLPVQHLDDRAAGAQDRDHQHAAARPVGHRRLLPVLVLRPGQRRNRQDVLVVCRASVGGRRVGAGDGLAFSPS